MDTVEAYVEDHLTISRGGEGCVWQVQKQDVPSTELEAVADGVTLSGEVSCPSSGDRLMVASSIFVDGFPGQTTVLRLELPNGFAERGVLDRSHLSRELDITELYTSLSSATTAPGAAAMSRGDARLSRLADALQNPHNGWREYLALLLAAFVIGMLHALGPGHGKALIAATLVGEQATFRRLLALGTVMTVTHVSDVFLLALLADAATALIAPTKIFLILQTISAAGLVLFGGVQIVRAVLRYRMVRMNPAATESEEAHMRAHALGLPHGHGASEHEHHHDTVARAATCHELPAGGRGNPAPTFKHALWTGFIGSLAPCPTAWAIFLAALSLGKLGLGIGLLVAFTIGLHITILVLGLLILWSRAFAIRHTPPAVVYILPIVSAIIITGLGLFLLFR
jgi:ABC-type nickel/cobalt efflux system permease component RcnA